MHNSKIIAVVIFLSAASAYACNIPVFRYALERWRSDTCELLVFHDGPLDATTSSQIESLRKQSIDASGRTNVKVQSVNVKHSADATITALWTELQKSGGAVLPYAVVRAPHSRGPITAWHGKLDGIAERIFDSPLRKRLSERLLNGDSIVWLILKSPDSARNERVGKLIRDQSAAMANKLALPEGIGLPGSELHSEVPLFLKFTSLEIDRDDSREQFLVGLFSGLQSQAYAEGQPLVIPVFGRGRALEVIPADQVDEKLFEELTLFLCGACSCQVKESNPGFDLLISTDWNLELFGENGPLPPPPKTIADQSKPPTFLPIAPGSKKP